jgi:thiosulfate reductase cytochrome b subunit
VVPFLPAASPPRIAAMTVPMIHPLAVRVMHWTNAVAAIVMVLSGWRIYNASPILPFRFPSTATLGGWLGGALLWHFAAMWLLSLSGL